MQGRTDSVAVAFFCFRCYFYTWCVCFFFFVCLCVYFADVPKNHSLFFLFIFSLFFSWYKKRKRRMCNAEKYTIPSFSFS